LTTLGATNARQILAQILSAEPLLALAALVLCLRRLAPPHIGRQNHVVTNIRTLCTSLAPALKPHTPLPLYSLGQHNAHASNPCPGHLLLQHRCSHSHSCLLLLLLLTREHSCWLLLALALAAPPTRASTLVGSPSPRKQAHTQKGSPCSGEMHVQNTVPVGRQSTPLKAPHKKLPFRTLCYKHARQSPVQHPAVPWDASRPLQPMTLPLY
jgi:hypothetical protein